ncbi:hypothetical protein RFI_14523 [Reticulomyxa filosa]|uniref:Uncharacterized protein n=1 Tax=Reticulomyxa filosa TaxID=46433 RepID=X6N9S6_RETFI|nr:hypothetical protein RFI_14523 [Reticulomyxa filosa]|eukprot:ETO22668.1 hypothetical protein RFI_14523 [Reticulomyxa filosa]
MPKDIKSRIVLLFHPSLYKMNYILELMLYCELFSPLCFFVFSFLHTNLKKKKKLGANEKDIIIFTFIASRAALVALAERFAQIHVWCVCVDAVKHGKLTPGIGSFKHRYKYVNLKKSKQKQTQPTSGEDKEKTKDKTEGSPADNPKKNGNDTPVEPEVKNEGDKEQDMETEMRSENFVEVDNKLKEPDERKELELVPPSSNSTTAQER